MLWFEMKIQYLVLTDNKAKSFLIPVLLFFQILICILKSLRKKINFLTESLFLVRKSTGSMYNMRHQAIQV